MEIYPPVIFFFFLTIWSQYAFVRTRLLFILDFVQGERRKSVERLRGMHERSMEISQDHQGEHEGGVGRAWCSITCTYMAWEFFLIQPYFGFYVLCIYIWACIYMCYLRPDSLLAALMDDLVYLHRSVEYKCAWSCPGGAYTNKRLAMVNAATGAMNFYQA